MSIILTLNLHYSNINDTIHLSEKYTIEKIAKSETAHILAKKLYNLAKNDNQVANDFTNNLHNLLKSNNIYECLVEELLLP